MVVPHKCFLLGIKSKVWSFFSIRFIINKFHISSAFILIVCIVRRSTGSCNVGGCSRKCLGICMRLSGILVILMTFTIRASIAWFSVAILCSRVMRDLIRGICGRCKVVKRLDFAISSIADSLNSFPMPKTILHGSIANVKPWGLFVFVIPKLKDGFCYFYSSLSLRRILFFLPDL
jgi:hypothetical protein